MLEEEASINDRLTLHDGWSEEKHEHEDDLLKLPLKTRGWSPPSCSTPPRRTNSEPSSILDLASILEPRPLPPFFRFCRVTDSTTSSSDGTNSTPAFIAVARKSPGRQVSTSTVANKTKKMNPWKVPPSSLSSSSSTSYAQTSNGSRTRRKWCGHSREIPLPESFVPGPYTVVIGRGRQARQAPGTQRLHAVVAAFLDDYANAPDKAAKSRIVTTVWQMIRDACPIGAFVRSSPDGRWHEVRDSVATQRVGYTIREHLGQQYRPSSQAKKVAKPKHFATSLSASTA